MVKFYTLQNPPCLGGEVSKEKSETRQSDNMDIKETIARFFRDGGVIPTQQGAQDLTAEEREALFDGQSEQDLMDADLVDQKNFVDEVKEHLKSVQSEEKEETKESIPEVPTVSDEKSE